MVCNEINYVYNVIAGVTTKPNPIQPTQPTDENEMHAFPQPTSQRQQQQKKHKTPPPNCRKTAQR